MRTRLAAGNFGAAVFSAVCSEKAHKTVATNRLFGFVPDVRNAVTAGVAGGVALAKKLDEIVLAGDGERVRPHLSCSVTDCYSITAQQLKLRKAFGEFSKSFKVPDKVGAELRPMSQAFGHAWRNHLLADPKRAVQRLGVYVAERSLQAQGMLDSTSKQAVAACVAGLNPYSAPSRAAFRKYFEGKEV